MDQMCGFSCKECSLFGILFGWFWSFNFLYLLHEITEVHVAVAVSYCSAFVVTWYTWPLYIDLWSFTWTNSLYTLSPCSKTICTSVHQLRHIFLWRLDDLLWILLWSLLIPIFGHIHHKMVIVHYSCCAKFV